MRAGLPADWNRPRKPQTLHSRGNEAPFDPETHKARRKNSAIMSPRLCGSHLLKQPGAFDGFVAQFATDDQLLRAPNRTTTEISAWLDGKDPAAAEPPSLAIGKFQDHRDAALGEREAHIGMNVKADGKRQPAPL